MTTKNLPIIHIQLVAEKAGELIMIAIGWCIIFPIYILVWPIGIIPYLIERKKTLASIEKIKARIAERKRRVAEGNYEPMEDES